MRREPKKASGFTYVEIIACLCIVTLIVGPLSYSFFMSVKTRVNAGHIDEATSYAETLMGEIKEKMTKDIKQKYEVEHRRIDLSTWDDTKKNAAKWGAGKYLLKLTDAEFAGATTRPSETLDNLFGYKKVDGKSQLDTRYHTDQYAYEVAIWHMDELTLTSNELDSTSKQFIVNTTSLEKATKFYTDAQTDSEYQFDETYYESLAQPIEFKITDEMYKIFKDDKKLYIPNGTSTPKIVDVNSICFTDQDNTEATNSEIQFEKKEIKNNTTVCGYHFTLKENAAGTGISDEKKKEYTSIIDVDLNQLLKDEKGKTIDTYEGYTLKFTNQTDFNQLIRINHHLGDAISEGSSESSKSAQDIYEDFNVVATNTGKGKSTISYITKEEPFDNYLIAIVVREKNPVQGKEGKIVKKMIDIYSYDVNVSG